MGRKSREKLERRKRSHFEQQPDDVFEIAPGVIAAVKGRVAMISNQRSREEHQHYLEVERQARPSLMADLEDTVSRLRLQIASLPIEQLLCNIAVIVSGNNPETYKEYESRHPFVVAEYPTWLYVTGDRCSIGDSFELIDVEQFETVMSDIEKAITLTQRLWATQFLESGDDASPALDRLAFRTRIQNLFTRNADYAHHLHADLLRLFGPMEDVLADAGAPNIVQTLQCVRAVSTLVNERLADFLLAARKMRDEAIGYLSGALEIEAIDASTKHLLTLCEGAPKCLAKEEIVARGCSMWAYWNVPSVFRISPSVLAGETGLPLEVAMQFFATFETGPGEPRGRDSRPNRFESLVERPLLRVGPSDYLAHLVATLDWAVRPRLENLIRKSSPGGWRRYERVRSSYLEDEALACLTSTSRHAQAHPRLTYYLDESRSDAYEVDGIFTADEMLVIVEAKSGTLRPAGRRGAPSMVEDLNALVDHPSKQAQRVLKYLESRDTCEFASESGGTVRIRRSDYSRIVVLTPTMEHLEAFATHVSDLREIGLLADGVLPWSVYLGDLRIIADCVSGVGQLAHFLERRSRIENRPFGAHDEIDMFGCYLSNGLYFDNDDPEIPISLTTFSTAFDDYYMYIQGIRKTPAAKPSQKLPDGIRHLVDELERSGVPGFVAAVCALLDMNESSRDKFADFMVKRRTAANERGFSAFSLGFDRGETWLTYVAARWPNGKGFEEYISAVKYRGKARRVVGIMQSAVDDAKLSVCVQDFAWRSDAVLSDLAERVFASLASRFEGKSRP
jgi:hypothetical protein